MINDSFYVGFAAFIQLTVGFNFGLMYLYQNNRSPFKSTQSLIFDGFRQNALTKWLLSYPKYVATQIKPKIHGESFAECKAWLMNNVNAISAACNYERICDYISATGIASAFYGLEWLLLVPWSFKYMEDAQRVYGTCALVAAATTVFMFIHAVSHHITRGKMFLFASIAFILFHFVAFVVWPTWLRIPFCFEFDNIFFATMFLAASPIAFFITYIIALILWRILRLAGLILATLPLHLALKVKNHKKK